MIAEQLTLPRSGMSRFGDPATSRAAAESLDPEAMHVELRRVYAVIERRGDGATAGEVQDALAVDGIHRERGSVARRITDLRQGGLVVDSGQVRRRPRKGARDEIVWTIR